MGGARVSGDGRSKGWEGQGLVGMGGVRDGRGKR